MHTAAGMQAATHYLPPGRDSGASARDAGANLEYENPDRAAGARALAALSIASPNALRGAMAHNDPTRALREYVATTCSAQNMSPGWLAMYELCRACAVETLVDNDDVVRTFHASDDAGGEVCAVNHYLATHSARNRPGISAIRLDWRASRHVERDPARHRDMIACNRQRWVVDTPGLPYSGRTAPGDGNMASHHAVVEAAARVRREHPDGVDFYSGTSVASTPGTSLQVPDERANASILMGQLACGMMCLRAGGALVLRMAQWDTPLTRSLISIATEHFSATSVRWSPDRPALAPLVYVVCTGYDPGDGSAAGQIIERMRDVDSGKADVTAAITGREPHSGAFVAALSRAGGNIARLFTGMLIAVASSTGRSKKSGASAEDQYQSRWLSEHPIVKLPARARISESLT
jgi:hypothetical protein